MPRTAEERERERALAAEVGAEIVRQVEERKARHTEAEYVAAARRMHHDEGTLEVEPDAPVSWAVGEGGAYVQAWVWVPDDAIARARGDRS